MLSDPFSTLMTALHRRARHLCSCPHEAADLAQEAALRVWRQTRNGTVPDDLEAYAMVTLSNLARSRWRMRRDTCELDDNMASIPPDAPARIACAELRAAMARLPRAQGRLMELVAAGETSPVELAKLTEQPLGTVMSRLARARARLRADLDLGATAPSSTLYDSTQL
ncbi:MAG: RNA polymerase sigma factor [Sedimentitalea sp.]